MNAATTTPDGELDRVERSTAIDASAEEVWELVCRPGWWINDGDIDPDSLPAATSGVQVVDHPQQGRFEVHTLRADRPRYLSYRWIGGRSSADTLVEFFLEERVGGVTLRVVESGFEALAMSLEAKNRLVEEHRFGWELELLAVRKFVVAT
ncbi:ATPase [Kribbella sp. NBC_00662]|uniref:ATPase n=1 Tax=Kribbella sp. NBC_00662 TaxID=2975969 RepID=UPI003245D9A4